MKKLSNLKWFTLGIVACLLVTTLVVPAFAASFTKTAQLTYKDIKIILNGNVITPRDVDGNVVEPFIIDGTTYLPIRAGADAMGYDVAYDASIPAVILTSQTDIIVSPSPSKTPAPSPVTEVLDTALQGQLITRISACQKTASVAYSNLQNTINGYISRGMGRDSNARAAIEAQASVSADISAMQSLQSSIRSATTNDELAQYEIQVAYFESVY